MTYYPVSLLPHDENTPSNAAQANNEPIDEEGSRIRNEESASHQDDADTNGQTSENAEDHDGKNAGHIQETQGKAQDEQYQDADGQHDVGDTDIVQGVYDDRPGCGRRQSQRRSTDTRENAYRRTQQWFR